MSEFEPWGPLAPLIGEWSSGFTGRDVSFHNDQGKLGETTYREATTFTPIGPIHLAHTVLYGLDYRTATWREGDEQPFHREVGYWLWDGATRHVVRCFVLPFATTVTAGGFVEPDATTFKLSAALASTSHAISSERSFSAAAQTSRFDVTLRVHGDAYSYDQTTVIEYQGQPTVILHTDRNRLARQTPKVARN